jgi:hypothetical protein
MQMPLCLPEESRGRRYRRAGLFVWKRSVVVFASIQRPALFVWKVCVIASASSLFAVPLSAVLTGAVVGCLYLANNAVQGGGEPFAWCDGTSAWPSIAIIIFAGLLSFHFILKSQNDLTHNAKYLTSHFRLRDHPPDSKSWFGWDAPPLDNNTQRIDIVVLWERYLFRGRFLRRMFRVLPMVLLYILTIGVLMPLIGGYPSIPIRGAFNFFPFILFAIVLFLVLTFFVIDSTLLHCRFLEQFGSAETHWPDDTFRKFGYPINGKPKDYESELAYFWDVLLISKRTEAVGNLIYYPFIILFCLIATRFPCFDNWTWTPALIVTLSMHFSLALYAAWKLPRTAVAYRDKVLGELNLRRRKAFMIEGKTPEAIDTMIEEVQSNHKGAFSYPWQQPAIRALLLPSGGIGLATLLQYLPH